MKKAICVVLGLLMCSPVFADGLNGKDGPSLAQAWFDAVTSGDENAVAAVLAPEFQIVRGSGRHYDAAAYVAGGLPHISEPPSFTVLQVTESDDMIVVSYQLNIEADVDGVAMTRQAPRLTVFRRIDGAWYVSAHANFALPQTEEN